MDPRIEHPAITDTDSFPPEFGDSRRAERVEEFRRSMAHRQYGRYVNHAPIGSADGWKESPRKHGRAHGSGGAGDIRRWCENEMRRAGWGDAISQKKASIRQKWNLRETAGIRPKRTGARIEPVYTGMF